MSAGCEAQAHLEDSVGRDERHAVLRAQAAQLLRAAHACHAPSHHHMPHVGLLIGRDKGGRESRVGEGQRRREAMAPAIACHDGMLGCCDYVGQSCIVQSRYRVGPQRERAALPSQTHPHTPPKASGSFKHS